MSLLLWCFHLLHVINHTCLFYGMEYFLCFNTYNYKTLIKYPSTLYSPKRSSLGNKCNDYLSITPTLIWTSVLEQSPTGRLLESLYLTLKPNPAMGKEFSLLMFKWSTELPASAPNLSKGQKSFPSSTRPRDSQ